MKTRLFHDPKVAVTFGFFMDLLEAAEKFKTDRFLFAWDGVYGKNVRRKLLPSYKFGRHRYMSDSEKELLREGQAQFKVLRREILPALGFRKIFRFPQYEADDIVAWWAKNHGDTVWPTGSMRMDQRGLVVVSSDKDLWQCLGTKIDWWSPSSRIHMTQEAFIKEYRLYGFQWAVVKAYAGCTSDNIKGVPSIGDKTAIDIVNGSLATKNPTKNTRLMSLLMNDPNVRQIVDMNTQIVTLPFASFPTQDKLKKDHLSWQAFKVMCRNYGLGDLFLTGDMRKRWKKVFTGTVTEGGSDGRNANTEERRYGLAGGKESKDVGAVAGGKVARRAVQRLLSGEGQ
jgi:hypothetical protein